MERSVRLRIASLRSGDWVRSFESELARLQLRDAIQIVAPPSETEILKSADATILTALISGGTQVLAAVIAALAAVYVGTRAKDKQAAPQTHQPLIIVIQGSKDSAELKKAPPVAVSEVELNMVLQEVGILREISIK